MKKQDVLKGVEKIGLVPVIRTKTEEDAKAAVEVLVASGVPVAEVTYSVPNAPQVIADLKASYGDDCYVGAGTVTTLEECEKAVEAGSDFIVTPVTVKEIIAYCNEKGVAVICGALTPTEVVDAWRAGADLLKIFPAVAMGGPSYIKNLAGPLPQIPVAPTGGVTPDNAGEFIKNGARFVGAGSDLVPGVIDFEAKERIRHQSARYLSAVRSARA